jgi:hypothetical protein
MIFVNVSNVVLVVLKSRVNWPHTRPLRGLTQPIVTQARRYGGPEVSISAAETEHTRILTGLSSDVLHTHGHSSNIGIKIHNLT